jgi:urea carboxylase
LFEVMHPGLETSVQDLPGRIGYWEQGFPPSGPVDMWSFRLANLLVGNDGDAAALECQFLGPTLKFLRDGHVAVTGADMAPTLDSADVPRWRTITVRAGQVLALSGARTGARSYVAFAGGIDTPPVLGSRSTFHMAGVGGVNGYALKAGQQIPVAEAPASVPILEVAADYRPSIVPTREWPIEVVAGPNDSWLDAETVERFLTSEWVVQAKSSRTGMRLTGPALGFSERATKKRPEHGHDPSNILDHGYPLGAINLAGQTPIILINDGPSTGGFINPFTVPSAAFWKLGQARPGNVFRFHAVTVKEAQERRRALDRLCTADSLVAA